MTLEQIKEKLIMAAAIAGVVAIIIYGLWPWETVGQCVERGGSFAYCADKIQHQEDERHRDALMR